jgi:hypothetical protein
MQVMDYYTHNTSVLSVNMSFIASARTTNSSMAMSPSCWLRQIAAADADNWTSTLFRLTCALSQLRDVTVQLALFILITQTRKQLSRTYASALSATDASTSFDLYLDTQNQRRRSEDKVVSEHIMKDIEGERYSFIHLTR